MEFKTRHIKYVFADVVAFTHGRTVQAQMAIVEHLNLVFRQVAKDLETLFLPTGDGLCAAIIQPACPHDAHLKMALYVMAAMDEWSAKQGDSNRRCSIRFGIHEGVDCVYDDINGQKNVVGAGINHCQRLMAAADGNQIIVGRAAYDNLCVWDEYQFSFRALRFEVKHGLILDGFQYIGAGGKLLNVDVPDIVKNSDPIDFKLNEEVSTSSSAAYPRLIYNAVEKWEHVIEDEERRIATKLDELQEMNPPADGQTFSRVKASEAFKNCQVRYRHFLEQEVDFVTSMRTLVPGSMYRFSSADHHLEIVRQRAKWLRQFSWDWLNLDPINQA